MLNGRSAHMKFFWVSLLILLGVGKADVQIFYKTGRVRVVISTANMVDYDWNWIENVRQSSYRQLTCSRCSFRISYLAPALPLSHL